MLVPAFYIEAKKNGASPEELAELVRRFCAETLCEDGQEEDPHLVCLMCETYEHMLQTPWCTP